MPRVGTGTEERERIDGRVFLLRFRAFGKRQSIALRESGGWTRDKA